MAPFLRPFARHSAVAARHMKQCTTIRAFHSPFVALNQAPTSPHQVEAHQQAATFAYEKQYDFSYEPLASGTSFDNRIFVVSQPDASARHYQVPSGVYPISLPYSDSKHGQP